MLLVCNEHRILVKEGEKNSETDDSDGSTPM